MLNHARQLPSISITLPTIIPSNNVTELPSSISSVPVSDVISTSSSSSITSIPEPSSSSSSDPRSSTIISLTESKNLTSDPASSVTPTSTAIFITQPSLVSSLSSVTVTENITTIITSINGQATTFTSHLPTSLVGLTPNTTSSPRIAIIAGVTAGSIFLLCLALACVFGYRRHKLRKILAASNQKKEGKGLLDGEEFDDDVVPRRSYQDQYLVASSGASAVPRSVSPAPSLIRSRVSESGSIFREEVWPPPGFIDPIAKRSSQVDLSRIVDDVMGPSTSESPPDLPPTSSRPGHDYFGSIGSSYSAHSHSNFPSTSHDRDATAASTSAHSQLSIKSTTPLIPTPLFSTNTGNDRHIPSPPSSYTDPFASSQNETPSPSLYYPSALPPGALAPTTPGQSPALIAQLSQPVTANDSQLQGSSRDSQTSPTTAHDTRSVSPSPSNSRLYAASTAQPKKSSPLARVLTGDTKIWLGRSPHPPK